MKTMYEPNSNSEEKGSCIILKDKFSSKTESSIFTSIAPELLDQSNDQPRIKSLRIANRNKFPAICGENCDSLKVHCKVWDHFRQLKAL